MPQNAVRKTAFYRAKGHLSACKRRPFGLALIMDECFTSSTLRDNLL